MPRRSARRGRGSSLNALRSSMSAAVGVAFGQEHRAGGPSGVCSQERRSELGGDPAELLGRDASGGGVARGEHDLDVGAEQARSRHRVLGLAEDAADHRVGDVDPALGEPQQREAGLWVAAELVGALIRGFGAVEVADEAEEIALDHARAAERGGVDGSGETVAGVSGLDRAPRATLRAVPAPRRGAGSSGRGRARAPAGCRTSARTTRSTRGTGRGRTAPRTRRSPCSTRHRSRSVTARAASIETMASSSSAIPSAISPR